MSDVTLPVSRAALDAPAVLDGSDRHAPRARDLGVNFPESGGARSSTGTAQHLLSVATKDIDPGLAEKIRRTEAWRASYPQVFHDLTRAEARSAAAALHIARTGLDAALDHFVFVTANGDQPLSRATTSDPLEFETTTVVGRGRRDRELVVPYHGKLLTGTSLLRQVDSWVDRGVTEPSFAEAVGAVVRNPEWLDLSDRTFALVGAGAAMGPFAQLMSWGATVAAVDLPRPEVWQRLARVTEESAGSMLMPVRRRGDDPAESAGADLLNEVGAVGRWLRSVSGPVTLGNYGYADGALFVRLSIAFELLVRELTRHRSDLSLGYLATPSDSFLVPDDAVAMARRRARVVSVRNVAARSANVLSGGAYFRPNYQDVLESADGRYGLVNAFILEQGQNYALAKRLQRWRMVVSRAEGLLTSVHVAPPTRTQSVHKNPVMAQRQRLTAKLGMEAFDAATSQALGAAILVHDLRNPASPANPAVDLAHPHEAFMFAANPGGRWRAPFEPASALPVLHQLDRLPLVSRLLA